MPAVKAAGWVNFTQIRQEVKQWDGKVAYPDDGITAFIEPNQDRGENRQLLSKLDRPVNLIGCCR